MNQSHFLPSELINRLAAVLRVPMSQALARVRRRFLTVHGPGDLRIVLWGTGALARLAVAGLAEAGIRPLAVCDQNPERWHADFAGMEILPPLVALDRFGKEAVFVPAIYTNQELLRQLEALGVRALPLSVLAWLLPDARLCHCAMELPAALHRDADQVLQGMALWADDPSRLEYLGQIRWRACLDGSLLPQKRAFDTMFNPVDLFDFKPDEHFVDCGAFDGDSIRNYLRHHPQGAGPITAIEPDPVSFQRLAGYLGTLEPGQRDRVQALQRALGAGPGVVPFSATGSVASSLGGDANTLVRQEALDDLEAVAGATFIKMDIEGTESEALRGGRRLLQTREPILGVCLYHRPDDLWRIPRLIHAINPDYRLFLRRYSDECWEQVCYAVPPGRLKPHP